MPSNSSETVPQDERQLWQAYYLLQYERVAHHEQQRAQVSSIVVVGSGVALGVVGLQNLSPSGVFAVLGSVVVSNAFAALAARNERRWVKVHQARAATVLEKLSPSLSELQDSINGVMRLAAKAVDRNALLRTDRLLVGVHLVLISLSLILMWWR